MVNQFSVCERDIKALDVFNSGEKCCMEYFSLPNLIIKDNKLDVNKYKI